MPPDFIAARPGHPTALARSPDPIPPLLTMLTVVVVGYALLFVSALVAQVPIRLIDYHFFGLDFNDFWTASGDILAGRDPYLRPRFVTPPLSWLPTIPLAGLGQPAGALVFLGIDLLAMALGVIGLVCRFGLSRSAGVTLALACSLSPSTMMLLERGNLDGLVFLAVCGSFVLGAGGLGAPALLALATGLKIYPAVFLVALLAHRRIGAALLGIGAVLSMVMLMPSAHAEFVHNQIGRAANMRIAENLSALAWFWLLDLDLVVEGAAGLAAHSATILGGLLYAAALGACLGWDARLVARLGPADRTFLLASYAGFCVSMPSLVYLYSGVILLVPAAALGLRDLTVGPTTLRRWAVTLGATMLPAQSFALTLGSDVAGKLNLVPPAASLLLIVEAVLLRVELRRSA